VAFLKPMSLVSRRGWLLWISGSKEFTLPAIPLSSELSMTTPRSSMRPSLQEQPATAAAKSIALGMLLATSRWSHTSCPFCDYEFDKWSETRMDGMVVYSQ
jgi:hypothetical protein